MSELTQSSGPCCAEDLCCDPIVTNIPGPQGEAGAAGAAGAAGVSAFTTLTAGFTMPPGGTVSPSVSRTRAANVATIVMGVNHNLTTGAVVDVAGFGGAGYNLSGVTVTITSATAFTYASPGANEGVTADVAGSFSNTLLTVSVATSAWIVPGPSVNSVILIQSAGYVQANAVPSATTVTIKNLETGVSGIYPDNAAAGTAIPNGSKVSPGGVQGPGGAAAAGGLLAANNLSDVANTATSRTNLGLGSSAVLTAAQVFQVANNLSEGVAATKRTNLGLGTIATQSAAAVAITGGAVNATLGLTTPLAAVVSSLAIGATGGLNLGQWIQTGPIYTPQSVVQSLLAATAIAPNAAKIAVIGNGGAVTLTATPTITVPANDGQLLLIKGTSAVNTVTLQDITALAGTQLKLGNATRLLGLNDTILLSWDAAVSLWSEVAYTNVV